MNAGVQTITRWFIGDGASNPECRTTSTKILLFALALLAVGSSVQVYRKMGEMKTYSEQLVSKTAPRALQSLTLYSNVERAQSIIDEWNPKNPTTGQNQHASLRDTVKQTMNLDQAFIWVYVASFVAWAIFACAWAYLWDSPRTIDARLPGRPWIHLTLMLVATALLAAADSKENGCILELLDRTNSCSLASLRLAAQTKYALIGLLILSLALALLIGLRRELRSRADRKTRTSEPSESNEPLEPLAGGSFQDLVGAEHKGILSARGDRETQTDTSNEAASEEPKVIRSKDDYLGLALSGGGIRSAIFNLGLLQGLHRFDLLRHVDYLATVSGGGYIGGFWSRWLKENPGRINSEPFPDEIKESTKNFSGNTRVFESKEIRHIREFSNFLVPRTGMFDTETWGAVVVAFASVIPGVLSALSVLGLSLVLWLVLTFYFACPHAWGRAAFMAGLTALVLFTMEAWWQTAPTGVVDAKSKRWVVIRSIIAIAVIAVFVGSEVPGWNDNYYLTVAVAPTTVAPATVASATAATAAAPTPAKWGWVTMTINPSYETWWNMMGISRPQDKTRNYPLVFIPRLYEPTLLWLITALAFMAARFRGVFRPAVAESRVAIPSNDRTTMRLLGVAMLWAVLATFWQIGVNLSKSTMEFLPIAFASAGSAGLFALLRNWIGQTLIRPHKATIREKLKPYLPQILAYLTVALAWAAAASALIYINKNDWMHWYHSTIVLALFASLVLLVDPQEFGFHGVYRDRICRAFLGAAYPEVQSAADNRQTDFRCKDDIPLSSLPKRPLHLVCCAANNVSGDHLSTLSRGARSAVLSRYGVGMGNDWSPAPGLQLGSALTASAAAFNPNMGSVSMRVGPAVSFLMTALNLRLGLWVRNPRLRKEAIREHLLPGWLFYKEMAAYTDTTGSDLHLSDGAHFDNTGLYELVRRHCRYIIMSDCTADLEVAFDDFGSTARRIREDLGVEIEIDLNPLKPGPDGLSRQHAVVGTIDYGWFDKGTLVYIKPSLTGTEPADIRQYKTRNQAFPHEGTGDQFYDEAQWESYRRLGVQTVREVFKFAEVMSADLPQRAHKVFSAAKQEWYPAPADLVDRLLQMNSRFDRLEEELKSAASAPMLSEVFPELADIAAFMQAPDAPKKHQATTGSSSREEIQKAQLANVSCLVRVLTLMEDTVLACALSKHWGHPLNRGWVTCFARWVTAPTFRMWWPLLRPMYGPGLRRFLEDRFTVLGSPSSLKGSVSWVDRAVAEQGFAYKWWKERDHLPEPKQSKLFQFYLQLPTDIGDSSLEIQVALAAVTISEKTASWTSSDFFVPLCLWGSGLGSEFLRKLLLEIRKEKITRCVVTVYGPAEADGNQTAWEERLSFVDFYRQAGFRVDEIKQYLADPVNGKASKGRCAVLSKELVQEEEYIVPPHVASL